MIFGFFDSGLGGLLIMNSVRRHNSFHDYIYLGDTINLPYGPRPAIEILDLMEPYLLWLFQVKKCDYVCVACNTASVKSLELFLKKYPEYKKRFIDIVSPTQLFLRTQEKVLVLATEGTVLSNQYAQHSGVIQRSMPGLVRLIESGDIFKAMVMVENVIVEYSYLTNILLACTHYILLKDLLTKKYPHITFTSQDDFIIDAISKCVIHDDIVGTNEYFVSGDAQDYQLRYPHKFLHIYIPN
jgi:glutamate racemase